MHDHLEVGARVRLTHSVDRYPHFIAPEGATGRVLFNESALFSVRLDKHLPGAEEWENEVHWYPLNGDAPAEDLEVIA